MFLDFTQKAAAHLRSTAVTSIDVHRVIAVRTAHAFEASHSNTIMYLEGGTILSVLESHDEVITMIEEVRPEAFQKVGV